MITEITMDGYYLLMALYAGAGDGVILTLHHTFCRWLHW